MMEVKADNPGVNGAGSKPSGGAGFAEARAMLTGAQALTGFQLFGLFLAGFGKLPVLSKQVYFASLALLAVGAFLLAACCFALEKSEVTALLRRRVARASAAANFTLALALSGDLFVAAHKVTGSFALAVSLASLLPVLFCGLWAAMLVRHPPSPLKPAEATKHSREI